MERNINVIVSNTTVNVKITDIVHQTFHSKTIILQKILTKIKAIFFYLSLILSNKKNTFQNELLYHSKCYVSKCVWSVNEKASVLNYLRPNLH